MKKEVFAIIGVILNVIVLIDLLFKFTWIPSGFMGISALVLALLGFGFSITLFFNESKLYKVLAIVFPLLVILAEIIIRLTTEVIIG